MFELVRVFNLPLNLLAASGAKILKSDLKLEINQEQTPNVDRLSAH